MPSGSAEVGAGTYTSVSGITGAAGVNGLAEPAAAVPADAAAVVSGALPRGATGDVCGGLSGPGRTLAANNWDASAASSVAPIGRSLSASTDRWIPVNRTDSPCACSPTSPGWNRPTTP